MSKYWARTVVVTGALWAGIPPLWAHHSVSSVFEMTRRISVTGTLTKVDWINPHVVIAMEGKADDGKFRQWTFESNPPSWYRSDQECVRKPDSGFRPGNRASLRHEDLALQHLQTYPCIVERCAQRKAGLTKHLRLGNQEVLSIRR